jgi:hypothetical protein
MSKRKVDSKPVSIVEQAKDRIRAKEDAEQQRMHEVAIERLKALYNLYPDLSTFCRESSLVVSYDPGNLYLKKGQKERPNYVSFVPPPTFNLTRFKGTEEELFEAIVKALSL